MAIEHTCPSCQIRLRVADESAGKKVRCKCGAVSVVPAAAATPAPSQGSSRTAPTPRPAASSAAGAGDSIVLTCSACQQTLRAPASAAGKAVRCKCGQVVQLPRAATTRAASAAPLPSAAARSAPQAKSTAGSRSAAAGATATQAPPPPATAALNTATARTAAHPASPVGSIFDELTEADWHRESPITRAYAPPKASKDGAVLKQFVGQELKSKAAPKGAIPSGLITLSVLNFIGSAFYIFVGVAIIALVQVTAVVEQLQAIFPAITLAASVFCVYFIIWGVFLSVVGVGLLQQSPWGWYVAGVSYAHAVVDRFYTVVSSVMDGIPPARLGGMIGGVMMIIGITSYIYKAETRQHFKVKSMTPVIVCAAIGSVLAIVTLIAIEILAQSAESMIPAEAE